MMTRSGTPRPHITTGTLRIGDQWNAIHIIAHSQTYPLKAICELAENAIDAGAGQIQILRRRQRGDIYLEVVDDGNGVAANASGDPDFERIATHLCDSMKRHLDWKQRQGVHGEFGIGLLSFWSLGSELRMISAGKTGSLAELQLTRSQRHYTIRPVRGQLPTGGTRVIVGPLLEATRKLVTGEKIARYLSAELRDRIRKTGVTIQVVDRVSRKELPVTPREFDGERLEIVRRVKTTLGDLFVELYVRCDSSSPEAGVALCKDGTRVLKDVSELLPLQHAPWTDGRLEGLLDFEPLTLAPGTRAGVVPDEAFNALIEAVVGIESEILAVLEKREQAETDRASKQILRQVHKAFVSALGELPPAEYIFFDIPKNAPSFEPREGGRGEPLQTETSRGAGDKEHAADIQDPPESVAPLFPLERGPLHEVRITPRHPRRPPGGECRLMAVARDSDGARILDGVSFSWRVVAGEAVVSEAFTAQSLVASAGAGLVTIEVQATQGTIEVSDCVDVKFLEEGSGDDRDPGGRGLPAYRLEPEHGQSTRSRYDPSHNEIIINSAHRDFLASKSTIAKHRRYIGKLYAKEVVLSNFPHESPNQAMERLIELTLRTEDTL